MTTTPTKRRPRRVAKRTPVVRARSPGDQRLDQAVLLALQLPPADRVRLIQQVTASLFGQWIAYENEPAGSLAGMTGNTGPGLTAEEIDEARREMWGAFYMGGDEEPRQ